MSKTNLNYNGDLKPPDLKKKLMYRVSNFNEQPNNICR